MNRMDGAASLVGRSSFLCGRRPEPSCQTGARSKIQGDFLADGEDDGALLTAFCGTWTGTLVSFLHSPQHADGSLAGPAFVQCSASWLSTHCLKKWEATMKRREQHRFGVFPGTAVRLTGSHTVNLLHETRRLR